MCNKYTYYSVCCTSNGLASNMYINIYSYCDFARDFSPSLGSSEPRSYLAFKLHEEELESETHEVATKETVPDSQEEQSH